MENLVRIYDLRTIGLEKVLADINTIKTAFQSTGTATMDMSNITNMLGTNLSAITALLSKMQAAMENTAKATNETIYTFKKMDTALDTASIINYSKELGALGGRLAFLKQELAASTAQLADLKNEYKTGEISAQEYDAAVARIVTDQQQLKTQITEVTAAMTAQNKVNNPALLEEENIALAQNRVELQQRTAQLKLQAVAELAAEGSINEARASAALYRKELNALNLTTEEGVVEQKRLIAAIAELDLFIKENADLYTRQKINIGNYPTVGAELAAVRAELQKMVVAGEEGSVEFQKLTAKAQELSLAMRQVATDTGKAVFSLENVEKRVTSMGFRMLVHLAIFQVAMELYQGLAEWWTKDAKAAEELTNSI